MQKHSLLLLGRLFDDLAPEVAQLTERGLGQQAAELERLETAQRMVLRLTFETLEPVIDKDADRQQLLHAPCVPHGSMACSERRPASGYAWNDRSAAAPAPAPVEVKRFACTPSANSSIIFALKAGMSAGRRLVTRP